MDDTPEHLRGRTVRWERAAAFALAALAAIGLWLRLHRLSAEGFADDEVHKWLAANRYLQGIFSGDDVEHPMLMKWLIAASIGIGSRFGWAAETMTRLPNALAGGASVLVVALLARRLYGRTAALIAAALTAFSATLIGYQRVAKEDTLLGLFLMLLLWCMAEAKAAADDGRDPRRWELWAAASLAGMLASKYFFFLTPIPVVFYLWVRRESRWRVPLRRWLQLIAVAIGFWLCLNWSPLLPSTWEYAKTYTTGQQTVHGSLFFMGRIYHNLLEYGLGGTPPWFYAVFPAVKLAPATFLCALVGLGFALVQRRPAHKLMLSWVVIWFLVHSVSGSKWGRFFISVLPAFLIFAGAAAASLVERLRLPGPRWAAAAAAVLLLPGSEGLAAIAHAPHYRTYISPLGGGDARVQWYYPHCDYFDAGFREAVDYVAGHAEHGAELSTEIDWPAQIYVDAAGRRDLQLSLVRRGRACHSGRVCYVVVQVGRLYFVNEDAVANLSRRVPWHVEQIGGRDVVKVYRLLPGEMPFPDDEPPTPGPLVQQQER
jgi:4-amino-4-deoxy-L-arabinose transferase-like glycosyltransferase